MIGPDTVTKNPWSWFLTPWPGKIFTRIDSKVILWAQDTVTILTKKSYVYYSCSICTFFLEICFFPSKPQSLVIFLYKQTNNCFNSYQVFNWHTTNMPTITTKNSTTNKNHYHGRVKWSFPRTWIFIARRLRGWNKSMKKARPARD